MPSGVPYQFLLRKERLSTGGQVQTDLLLLERIACSCLRHQTFSRI